MLEFLYILKRKDVNMEINMKTVKFIGFFSKSIFALSNKLNVKTFIFQNKEESDYEK